MKKLTALAAGLLAVAQLTACALPGGFGGAAQTDPKERTESAAAMEETEQASEGEETAEGMEAAGTGSEAASSEPEESLEDSDLDTALFWSMGETVQMEITTGLTTEYLAGLCAFPVTVLLKGEETVLKSEGDLEKLGLDALYTDALLKAVENCDVRKQKIEGGKMTVGDDKNFVILEMEDSGAIGIREFNISE